jgi:hypothetical protein
MCAGGKGRRGVGKVGSRGRVHERAEGGAEAKGGRDGKRQ